MRHPAQHGHQMAAAIKLRFRYFDGFPQPRQITNFCNIAVEVVVVCYSFFVKLAFNGAGVLQQNVR